MIFGKILNGKSINMSAGGTGGSLKLLYQQQLEKSTSTTLQYNQPYITANLKSSLQEIILVKIESTVKWIHQT
jgi:hypothetical protein